MAPLFSLGPARCNNFLPFAPPRGGQCPNGWTGPAVLETATVAQDQLSRVAEDPVLLLVVLPPIAAAAFRIPTLVVVVFLQLLVDLPGAPVALRGDDAELLVRPGYILYSSNGRSITHMLTHAYSTTSTRASKACVLGSKASPCRCPPPAPRPAARSPSSTVAGRCEGHRIAT